jgi:cytochrome P450
MRNPSYYPFSIGPRNCVGQPLAIMELKTVLVHLIRRFLMTPNSKSEAPVPVLLLNIRPHEQVLLETSKTDLIDESHHGL